MPAISPALSEIIKRRLFRAREHLLSVMLITLTEQTLFPLAQASYEICSGLKLPAVKHIPGLAAALYLGDALANLTTVIDFDLGLLTLDRDPDEVVIAAQAIMQACHQIPLPEKPASRHPV